MTPTTFLKDSIELSIGKQKCTMRPKQQEEQYTQSNFENQWPLESNRNSLELKYSQTVSLTALNFFLMVHIWRKFLMRLRSHWLMCAISIYADNISTGRVPVEKTVRRGNGGLQKQCFALHAVCVCSMFLGFQYPWLEGSRKSSIRPNILRRSKACHHAGSFMKAIYLYLPHM